jgi:Ca2+-binding RTX toxin-like protein
MSSIETDARRAIGAAWPLPASGRREKSPPADQPLQGNGNATMTAYALATNRSTTFSLAAADTLTVTSQGSVHVIDPGAVAIAGAGANVLSLDGFVSSSNMTSGSGVRLEFGSSAITLGSHATVVGAWGLLINGGSSAVANSGTVIGHQYGLQFNGGSNSVVNAGLLYGEQAGLYFGLGAASSVINSGRILSPGTSAITTSSAVNVTNTGTIDGHSLGIDALSQTSETCAVVNSGYIYGRGSAAIRTTSGADIIVNNGFIQGGSLAAHLGSAGDFFDGRNGIQIGTVDGFSGDDVLYGGTGFDDLRGNTGNDQINGGAGADYLDGGADFDLVRYDFATAAVTVSLANGASNTGEAAGDVLLNFEGIVGSNFADALIGDGNANTFFGGLGADAIAGGAGGDTLNGGDGADFLFGEADGDLIVGGAGGDVIRGGLGGDLIVFNVGDNGDLIQNFNEGGVRDGFDLRGFFDATGYAGTDPRGAGIMQVLQSGADTDVYLYGAFAFRIEGVTAAAINDTYFLFQ